MFVFSIVDRRPFAEVEPVALTVRPCICTAPFEDTIRVSDKYVNWLEHRRDRDKDLKSIMRARP